MTARQREKLAAANARKQREYVERRNRECEGVGPHDPRLSDPRYAGLTHAEATGAVAWSETLGEREPDHRIPGGLDVRDFAGEGGRTAERIRR